MIELPLQPWYQQFIIDGKPTTRRPFMNKALFSRLLPLIPQPLTDKVILDLACNAGFVSFELAKLGADVTGFDNSELYLHQASFVMQNLPVPKVKFIQADIETLDLSTYSPDLILLLSVLYHLKNPKAMIKKVCALKSDIIASFRLPLYDKYVALFLEQGRRVISEVTYGRKKAALFRPA